MSYFDESPRNSEQNAEEFNQKVSEFCTAMDKYTKNRMYIQLELIVATLIVALQALTLFSLLLNYDGTGFVAILIAIVSAYILTDFVNGFVHMYMDNNTRYASRVGPFISSFHLHHSQLKSAHNNALHVYFYESRTKFWLLGYLVGLALLQKMGILNYGFNVCLVSIGILSSLAEVSHYWCHNSTKKNSIIQRLQKWGLILSKNITRNITNVTILIMLF